jgi:peptidoglycan/xylan/chitin deacetylase (PgdA/CDA1 family)
MLARAEGALAVHPPAIYRALFPSAQWRIPGHRHVFLTFDDGPHPRITPWVLDLLRDYGLHATFFCVGENVDRYPDIYRRILFEGHSVGNHTYNHLQGLKVHTKLYLNDVEKAAGIIDSRLFRPPHGILRFNQFRSLRKSYRIVMWDVVTRDYDSRLAPEEILSVVYRSVREGSIVVFHDSEKAEGNLLKTLPPTIDFLLAAGYRPVALS